MQEIFEKIEKMFKEKRDKYENLADGSNFDGYYEEELKYFGMQEAYEEAIEIVNKVVEEYNDGWIPCSERLPETYDNLIICQRDGYVNVGWYSLNEFKDLNSVPYKDVIAWQPLPEPYKPKGEK